MSFAIKLDGKGWRAVNSQDDVIADEFYSDVIPDPTDDELLQSAKTNQIAQVTTDCGLAIISGFKSSALGAEHTYPSKPTDQTNLIGAVASGLAIIYFWCANADGVWDFHVHTDAQIKQVLADAGTQRMSYSAQLADLVVQIDAAQTVSAVANIIWV